MKNVIIAVTNDLSTDQRVHKSALAFSKKGYRVLLVGRKLRNSFALNERLYKTHRMKLFFERGPLFYIEYTIRLFFLIFFKRVDILLANDLDTLLPCYINSKIKGISIVYDTHEYFTGVPELQNRKIIRAIWKTIEKFIFPKLQHTFTVNESIAKLYKDEYQVQVKVVRNIPALKLNGQASTELNHLKDKKIILYQGAGINIDRGVEEAIQAMQYIDGTVFVIIGKGDIISELKQLTTQLNLSNKILFIPTIPFEKLSYYTRVANIGLTLDKDNNINYKYSLPNKLFDYIHAEVPVLGSSVVEVKNIIQKYDIGTVIESHDPKHIADKISYMLYNEDRIRLWKQNLKIAAKELCWEKEEQILLKIYEEAEAKIIDKTLNIE